MLLRHIQLTAALVDTQCLSLSDTNGVGSHFSFHWQPLVVHPILESLSFALFHLFFIIFIYLLSRHTKNHFNISCSILSFLGWIELAKDCKKKTKQKRICLMGRNCTSQHDLCDALGHASTSTLDAEGIRKSVSWAGRMMVEFWVTVSPWKPHVLNALGVDEWVSYCLAEG